MPNEHPGPWRPQRTQVLDERGADWADVVIDANGRIVCEMANVPGNAAALIALAPNLERLREIEWTGNDEIRTCPACGRSEIYSEGHQDDCWLGNTIAALDKAGT